MNCLIANNTALTGAGAYFKAHTGLIQSCTFADNQAESSGGGAIMAGSSNRAENCVFWNNTAPEGPQMSLVSTDIYTRTTVTYCVLEAGVAGVFIGQDCYLDWADGMQTGDPFFMTGPFGEFYLDQTAAGTEADVSSCLNTGSTFSDEICFLGIDPGLCLNDYSTSSNGDADLDAADIGFHYSILTGTLDCCVQWERPGDDPPSSAWSNSISVTVCGDDVWAEYDAQTDDWGCFQLTSIAGAYDLIFKGTHSLAVRYAGAVLAPEETIILDIDLLREGDADGDNLVTSADFFVLRGSYNLSPGDPGFDSRSDFNEDGAVTSADFFLLRDNYNSHGGICL